MSRHPSGAVVAGLLWLASACSGGPESLPGASGSPTAAPSTTGNGPSITPAPSAPGPALAWGRAPAAGLAAGAGNHFVNAVIATQTGLVAVGGRLSGGDGNAAVWVSADGYDWESVAQDDAVFGGPDNQMMNAVVAGGPGLVAVGWDDSGGGMSAAVWVSADGRAWERIDHDEAVFGGPGDQRMTSVTAGGPGLVAVGGEQPGGDWDAAVWVSADGYAWERIPHDEAIFGGWQIEEMLSVTAGGPGLVAVGGEYPVPENRSAAVWVSVDGYDWERIAADAEAFTAAHDQEMESVMVGGPGLIAVGAADADDQDAAVWVSADGYEWARAGGMGLVAVGNQQISWVIAAGPVFIGFGWDDAAGDEDAAVWVSTDGSSWYRTAGDGVTFGGTGDQQVVAATVGGPGLVAVGGEDLGQGWHMVVWISPPGD